MSHLFRAHPHSQKAFCPCGEGSGTTDKSWHWAIFFFWLQLQKMHQVFTHCFSWHCLCCVQHLWSTVPDPKTRGSVHTRIFNTATLTVSYEEVTRELSFLFCEKDKCRFFKHFRFSKLLCGTLLAQSASENHAFTNTNNFLLHKQIISDVDMLHTNKLHFNYLKII